MRRSVLKLSVSTSLNMSRGCCGAGCPDCPFRPPPKYKKGDHRSLF